MMTSYRLSVGERPCETIHHRMAHITIRQFVMTMRRITAMPPSAAPAAATFIVTAVAVITRERERRTRQPQTWP
jgi:hypothetical protein